ncbi:MAG TPA: glycosyltransferase [Polyangiaceae bacterium]|nr:glycosyltransferase [Polyangiaceae bacterium]
MLGWLGLGLLSTVVYTYAGYPVLVAVWARLRGRAPASQSDFEPTVSVCLSVHDGARHLDAKLKSLQGLDYPAHKLEILVFSDGSTDDSERIVRRFAETDPRIVLLSSTERLGKPSALNALAAAAHGEVLLMNDVRQTLAPHALRALLAVLADPQVGCVSGNLVLTGDTGSSAYWRYEKLIRGAEARLGALVGVSGSIYAIRRRDFHELPRDVLLDDMFVPLVVAKRQKRIMLSEAAEAYDEAFPDEQEFGRKARTLAGNFQLIAKLPWLLLPHRNPVWFQLWSHKLLRLACPFALLGLLLTSNLLAWGEVAYPYERAGWQALALGQGVFYALAALGGRAGRLGALARTFVVLNAAAVAGLWRFLRGTQSVAW